eukprot:SAG25_NODE_118_length_14760_cov_873.663666_15_plen_203_part_00
MRPMAAAARCALHPPPAVPSSWRAAPPPTPAPPWPPPASAPAAPRAPRSPSPAPSRHPPVPAAITHPITSPRTPSHARRRRGSRHAARHSEPPPPSHRDTNHREFPRCSCSCGAPQSQRCYQLEGLLPLPHHLLLLRRQRQRLLPPTIATIVAAPSRGGSRALRRRNLAPHLRCPHPQRHHLRRMGGPSLPRVSMLPLACCQ